MVKMLNESLLAVIRFAVIDLECRNILAVSQTSLGSDIDITIHSFLKRMNADLSCELNMCM